eukprot:2373777-Prorocentrum_lima.AAC.1
MCIRDRGCGKTRDVHLWGDLLSEERIWFRAMGRVDFESATCSPNRGSRVPGASWQNGGTTCSP